MDVKQLIKDAMTQGTLKHYKKFGQVKAIQATATQMIDTIIDGVKETTNTARPGDWIVTGPKGEQYVIGDEKFNQRYRPVSKPFMYEAIGECWAVEYKGEPFSFKAPWGEGMRIDRGDFLVTSKIGTNDIYRIERGVFFETYKRVN